MAIDFTPLPIAPAVLGRLVGNTILVFVTVLVVALRYLARLVTGSKLGWDDYLILGAVPQGIALLVCQGLWSVTGVGYPVVDVPPENFTYISTLFVPFELLYNCSIVTAKLSVLFFYLRVFTHGPMRRATKWLMIVVGIWGVANLLQSFLVCRVRDGHVSLVIDRCDDTPSIVSTAIFNCLTNLVIGLLPLYTIWSLVTVSVSTRLGLTSVFVLGVSVTLVSVYRIYLIASTGDTAEPTVTMGVITYLSVLEVNLSFLCNSLPMLLPLYSYWRYRKVFAADQDEYVSRIRNGNPAPTAPRKFRFEDVANGLPLETIYGQNNIHYTTAVGTGEARGHAKSKASISRSVVGSLRGQGTRDPFANASDGESTRNLAGITIEMKWTITEETIANPYKKI